jgi:eukaryotic-like serine/threonine-protein kinase
VRPAARSSPPRSTACWRRKATCASGKSVPTTAVSRTGARNDAATEKYEAAPPSTSSRLAPAVSTVSSATEPTTSRAEDAARSGAAGLGVATVLDMRALRLSQIGGRETIALTSPPMAVDDEIAALVSAGDYVGAAVRAEAAGDLRRAIQLYERVWRFADALPLAERLGDAALAVRLALDARAEQRAGAIAAAIPDDRRADLDAASAAFASRGRFLEAAGAAERAGSFERAARFYQRASLPLRAAHALERAGLWNDAGRLYEQVAAEAGQDGDAATAAEAQLALGALLGRLGQPLESTRALQAAARHPATARAAQQRLCLELGALGLPRAADEIARRLHARHPELPDSAAAIAELELSARSGRALSAEPLRRFGELRLIGAGTLGRVYAAEDRLLGETVVLKILSVGAGGSDEERLAFQRFVREAEASSRLRHPHIVRLRDVDQRAGILVLEYLAGGTLASALARHGRLPPAAVRRLALELLSALAAAHRAGIVHRDVKPANVFYDAAGNAKLADFGAAHLADFGGTQTAGFIGTLAYLSPEQISGAPIGAEADVYGLGVTLFEALTGRLPFLGPDIVGQHLGETAPQPSALHPGLGPAHDDVLERALRKRPADRYASADAMAEAIRGWPVEAELGGARAAGPLAAAGPVRVRTPAPGVPPARVALGRTARGQLHATRDARVGRHVLLEELDAPLAGEGRTALWALARAGGPHVQRVLALTDGDRAIVYEAPEGEPVPAAALPPELAAVLAPLWPAVEAAGVHLPGRPVWLTPGGPVIQVVAPLDPTYPRGP